MEIKNNFFSSTIGLLIIAFGIMLLSSIFSVMPCIYKKIYINVDGATYTVKTYKKMSIKTILKKNNIVINDNDIVLCTMDKSVSHFKRITILRIPNEQEQMNETVTWRKNYNSNLRKVELQKCIKKNENPIINRKFYDGSVYNVSVTGERIISKGFYRLLLFAPNNAIEKVYDLSKVKKMQMIATAYYPGDPLAWGDGTVTCLGQKMQRGIVAVDPKVIPLKTRLFIPGYGYGYAGDTGNMIKGKRIDLGVNNVQEEQFWMFKRVSVYILEKSNTY
jgi:3D (Asp-Asp-Asp) domain-containing protein